MEKSISTYTQEYLNNYSFESEMVRYRRQLVLERLAHLAPRTVIELGCGSELLAAHHRDQGGSWDAWIIVEPSETFAAQARAAELADVTVVEAFFEDVAGDLPAQPDVILCSGLLHEVPDAERLLRAIKDRMGPQTTAHINVPNARSLHRRLARSMGLIDDLKALSPRNTSLQQPRVYDLDSLSQQVAAQGLHITQTGGHLVKPFTHNQMEPLVEALGREVMDGLYALGKEAPDWASEIYIEAMHP